MIKAEWKKLFENPILIVILIAILMIPTIYAGLFLGSMWDPYGELNQLPVAVVNLDKSVTYNGETLSIGEELIKTLQEDMTLDFHFVDEKSAMTGLEESTYYMVVTIPEDFSRAASTVMDEKPQTMQLVYDTNPGTNYVASKLSESAMVKMESKIQESVTQTYAKAFMDQLTKIGDDLEEAADGTQAIYEGEEAVAEGIGEINTGSKKLANGTTQLADGAKELKNGTQSALDGAKTLNDGAGSLVEGASKLDSGAKTLADGSANLASGASKLAGGTSSVANGANKVSEGAGNLKNGLNALNSNSSTLVAGATQLSDGLGLLNTNLNSDTAKANMSTLVSGSGSIKTGLSNMSAGLSGIISGYGYSSGSTADVINSLSTTYGGDAGDPNVMALINSYNNLLSIYNGLYGNITNLNSGLSTINSNYALVDAGITTLAGSVSTAAGVVGQLSAGAANLNTGLQTYTAGVSTATAGATTLADGAVTLSNGANELSAGAVTLSTGASTLSGGATQLVDGTSSLYDGTMSLHDGSTALASGVQSLDEGAKGLEDGTGELSEGANQLYSGTNELAEGIPELTDGTQELMEGLKDGATEIAQTNTGDVQAEMFANPVDTVENQLTKVENNGHAMAAYMMSVGLWVCALAFCLMYPLTEYHGKLKSGLAWWASKESVLALLAASSAIVLVVMLHVFNGFEPERLGETLLAAVIAAEAFMAIMYFFNVLLGKVGSFIMLIFMVVQLAGSAGTYPVELSGKLAAELHWYVPFTYTVEAFRSTISGGRPIGNYLVYLIVIFVVFSILTVLLFQVRAMRLKEGKNTLNTYLEKYGMS